VPAYVIGEAEIIHPERMRDYGVAVAKAVALHGGKYLARGSVPETLEGTDGHKFLLIEFPDREAARNWFASAEYQAAKKLRLGNSNLRLLRSTVRA